MDKLRLTIALKIFCLEKMIHYLKLFLILDPFFKSIFDLFQKSLIGTLEFSISICFQECVPTDHLLDTANILFSNDRRKSGLLASKLYLFVTMVTCRTACNPDVYQLDGGQIAFLCVDGVSSL